jgi:hypothetical protein
MDITSYRYKFKNKKVHQAFKMLAIEQEKTMQELIHEALVLKYPKLIKP